MFYVNRDMLKETTLIYVSECLNTLVIIKRIVKDSNYQKYLKPAPQNNNIRQKPNFFMHSLLRTTFAFKDNLCSHLYHSITLSAERIHRYYR